MGDVATQLGHSLIQSIPYVLAALIALVGAYLGFRWNRTGKERDEAIDAYRKLMGIRVTWQQVVISRSEAIVDQLFYDRLCVVSSLPKTSWEFQQAETAHKDARDGIPAITETVERVTEACATLSLHFRKKVEIQSAIDHVLDFRTFGFEQFPQTDPIELLQAKDSIVAALPSQAEEMYGDPIDELLGLVKPALFEKSAVRRFFEKMIAVPAPGR